VFVVLEEMRHVLRRFAGKLRTEKRPKVRQVDLPFLEEILDKYCFRKTRNILLKTWYTFQIQENYVKQMIAHYNIITTVNLCTKHLQIII